MLSVRSLAPAMLYLLSATLHAQAPATADAYGLPFALKPQQLQALAAAVPADKSAEATVLLDESSYTFDSAQLLTYTHRVIFRIETAAGAENWAEARSQWDPWHEKPVQIRARIIRADGTVAELDQKTITDAPVSSADNDSEVYSSSRVRRAPLPGVAAAAIVEELYIQQDRKPYFNGGSAYRYGFGNNVPTALEKLTIDLPSSAPFHDQVTDMPGLVVTRSENNGTRHIVYESRTLELARIDSDIDLATSGPTGGAVEFSTGDTWASVARSYAALSDPQIQVEDVRAGLPAPAADRMSTISKILQQLHKDIRYTGVEFDEAQLTPQRPAEVLKRHYGDCKDKAAYLVAMLRASNIPAHLALLNAGTGRDVNPSTPGMNRFNHAIVYVPAGQGAPEMWIDATAEFNEANTLPSGDQGRQALIIAPGTTSLSSIPDSKPSDSVLVETRVYTLSPAGPSSVVESSETHGAIDASYRSMYGGPSTPKLRTDIEGYAKTAYVTKSLAQYDHGDGRDLLHPFVLSIKVDGAHRASTSLVDGAAYLFIANVLTGMPEWFQKEETPLATTASAEEKLAHDRAVQARSKTYTFTANIREQRNRFIIPPGFTVRALPPDKTTRLGTATFTETYTATPGLITASLRFDSGKSTLSAQEALDLRTAILELNKREAIAIILDETGNKLMAAGKAKEAFAAEREAIAASPGSAVAHVRLGRALLNAGVGDLARKEMETATQLDPKSALAWSNLASALEYNGIGVRFGAGFDRDGAIAAYKKAVPLRTEDADPRYALAILQEFDRSGARYAPGADLPASIAIYRELIAEVKATDAKEASSYRNNLAYALLYSRRFKEVDALLADLPAGINRNALRIISAVAQHDVHAGLAAADSIGSTTDERNKALVAAGGILAQLGLYAQSSQVLAAGIQNQNDAPAVARQIELYRELKRLPSPIAPVNDASQPVRAVLDMTMSGTATHSSLEPVFTRSAFAGEKAFQLNLDKALQVNGLLHQMAARSDLSEAVLRDLILGNVNTAISGDDRTGYQIVLRALGASAQNYFVVREDGRFHVVAESSDNVEIGMLALHALSKQQNDLAKSALDWKRGLVHKGGGDDPYEGPLLPLFWTVGSAREGADSPAAMHLAAVSLLAGSTSARPYLEQVATQQATSTGQAQINLDLLLAKAYVGTEQPAKAMPYIDALLKNEPDSTSAMGLAMSAYAISGDLAAWDAMLAPRLAKKPNDPDLLRSQARMYAVKGEYRKSREIQKRVLDTAKATSSDYNLYAWLGLFDNTLTPDITSAAQQSNMLSKNSSFGDLHTLACIYAAQGKTVEARQVLQQAMTAGNLSQPNGPTWLALGLLYEAYGLRDAALEAYRQVNDHQFDDNTYTEPTSSGHLAQLRIAALAKQ